MATSIVLHPIHFPQLCKVIFNKQIYFQSWTCLCYSLASQFGGRCFFPTCSGNLWSISTLCSWHLITDMVMAWWSCFWCSFGRSVVHWHYINNFLVKWPSSPHHDGILLAHINTAGGRSTFRHVPGVGLYSDTTLKQYFWPSLPCYPEVDHIGHWALCFYSGSHTLSVTVVNTHSDTRRIQPWLSTQS